MKIDVWPYDNIYFASLEDFETIDPMEEVHNISATTLKELLDKIQWYIRREAEYLTEEA